MNRSGVAAGAVAASGPAAMAFATAMVIAACGGARGGGAAPAGMSGLRTARVLARGVLAYDVAFDATGARVFSVELATEVELVVRDLGGKGATKRIRLGGAEWDVVDLAIDPAGARAAAAGLDGRVRLVDVASSRVEALPLDAPATAVAYSPDGRWLATGADSGVLCLRRTSDLAMVQCVVAHEARLAGIAFTPGGEALATAGWDGRVVVWESPSLAILAERRADGASNAVAFSPDGHMLAVARSARPPRRLSGDHERDEGSVIELWPWTAAAGASGPRTLVGHEAAVVAVGWLPDGSAVASGAWDRSVRLWDPESGLELGRVSFARVVRGIDVSPDGRFIAVASFTGTDLDGASLSLVQPVRR